MLLTLLVGMKFLDTALDKGQDAISMTEDKIHLSKYNIIRNIIRIQNLFKIHAS